MRHASFFTGIGGFDLAASWMGWKNIFQVENDPFCNKVLEKNFPKVKRYGDIKQFDGTQYKGAIDIISGGFPCQPFSVAGKRKGSEDDRYLWPEMLRGIREVQPSGIVGENVLGILNWYGGLVFEQVLSDLENEGYETQAFILPACGKNAAHKRYRVWFIAYNHKNRLVNEIREAQVCGRGSFDKTNPQTDTDNGQEREQGQFEKEIFELRGISRGENIGIFEGQGGGRNISAPLLCRNFHGIPNGMDRIGSLGNAIYPHIAHEIFKHWEAVYSEYES